MPQVSIEEAQARLIDIIHRLDEGDELVITENNRPVATLAKAELKQSWPCKAGSARGKIRISPDFDAPLEEFEEYMG
jgi:antitoxin (DNA-binding transcriptional repressor) of toxin-antitoxin stability system